MANVMPKIHVDETFVLLFFKKREAFFHVFL
jgi:hypothetical protein